jgi:hypothetical protein
MQKFATLIMYLKINKSFSIFFSDDFCPMFFVRIGFNADPDQKVEFLYEKYTLGRLKIGHKT